MSFLGGALSKLEPSERVRQALTRDLELRRSDERLLTRFSGYAYRGGADLILQHGRFYAGRTLDPAYEALRGEPNVCFVNALMAVGQDPSLRYCEGIYTTGFGSPRQHGWCITPDDQILEVTMPTREEELGRYLNALGMPWLPPERWGYYGVIFDPRLIRAHGDSLGLPMLDRGPAEIEEAKRQGSPLDYSEPHDFPILKVRYDPNRTEVP